MDVNLALVAIFVKSEVELVKTVLGLNWGHLE